VKIFLCALKQQIKEIVLMLEQWMRGLESLEKVDFYYKITFYNRELWN
jgi:hypothetical protein